MYSHLFKWKFKQPIKQKRKYIIVTYSSEPAHVEMLDAVSLILLHVIVC